MNQTQNAVRQVLMNELGLTRESVRKEVEDIISSVVRARVNALLDAGVIERLVTEEFNKVATTNRWTAHDAIAKLVTAAAEKQMRDYINANVRFTIALRPDVKCGGPACADPECWHRG